MFADLGARKQTSEAMAPMKLFLSRPVGRRSLMWTVEHWESVRCNWQRFILKTSRLSGFSNHFPLMFWDRKESFINFATIIFAILLSLDYGAKWKKNIIPLLKTEVSVYSFAISGHVDINNSWHPSLLIPLPLRMEVLRFLSGHFSEADFIVQISPVRKYPA